jgi:hypothetical protein
VRLALALAAFCLSLSLAPGASAHGRSASYSSWTLEAAGASVAVRVQAIELARLPLSGDEASRGGYFTSRLRALGCDPVARSFKSRPIELGWVELGWKLSCAAPPSKIESELFREQSPSHLHFVRVRDEQGALIGEQVLSDGARSFQISRRATAGPGFVASIGIGVHHILSGHDHLVFVLVLLLGASALRSLLWVITGFTLGHSLTLALAALGQLRPDGALIEALIGLSIAVIAVENGWRAGLTDRFAIPACTIAAIVVVGAIVLAQSGRFPIALAGMALFTGCHFAMLSSARQPERWRGAVAALFGLVHGFGFAGALFEAKLGVDRALPALFGFNLGVEIGQLAIVAVAWPLLALAARRAPELRQRVVLYASAAALAAGTFWFVERSLG